MGDTGKPPPPWPAQTMGERIVTAAWQAVAAHLAAADAASPVTAAADEGDPLPAAVLDRLR